MSGRRTPASRELPRLDEIESAAKERYEEMNWPTPEEEEWRRTDVTEFRFDEFAPYAVESSAERAASAPSPVVVDSGVTIRFVCGDCTELDISASLRDSGVSVIVDGGADGFDGRYASSRAEEAMRRLLRNAVDRLDNRLSAWHYSGVRHGPSIHIPAGVSVELPVVVEFFEAGALMATNPHICLVLEEGASATIVQVVRSAAGDRILCNAGFDAEVAANARLSVAAMNDLGSATTLFEHRSIALGRDAGLRHFAGTFGGELVKTRIEVLLAGAGAEARLDGAFLANGNGHMDIRTVQTHRAPHTSGRAYYKGAVRDSGRTVFQGLIDVGKTAVQTDAYLTNKNLMLGPGARADSIPTLKIRTDDVKCSHGSTTGRVDENEVFYLMSRGFARDEAMRALVEGYFEEIVRRADERTHELLMRAVVARLTERSL